MRAIVERSKYVSNLHSERQSRAVSGYNSLRASPHQESYAFQLEPSDGQFTRHVE